MSIGVSERTAHKAALAKAVEDADWTSVAVVEAAVELLEALDTTGWTEARKRLDLKVRDHYNAVKVLPADHQPRTWRLP